jgi:hypothetical protein
MLAIDQIFWVIFLDMDWRSADVTSVEKISIPVPHLSYSLAPAWAVGMEFPSARSFKETEHLRQPAIKIFCEQEVNLGRIQNGNWDTDTDCVSSVNQGTY